MIQLDLFNFVAEQPPVAIITKTTTHSVTHTPSSGYKVVLAPGLTSAGPRNPCIGCVLCNTDKSSYSCLQQKARTAYLKSIGTPNIAAIRGDGAYGFGN